MCVMARAETAFATTVRTRLIRAAILLVRVLWMRGCVNAWML